MLFNSISFLLVFVAILAIDRCCHWHVEVRRWGLLCLSYAFYSSWSWSYVPILLASTLLDFLVAQRIAQAQRPVTRAAYLGVSLALNLGLLSWFKYWGFFCTLAGQLFDFDVRAIQNMSPGFVPLGLSFFTFQTISYSIDVYRGELAPTKRLSEFALYVAFFPQLVAGPIVRAPELLPQLSRAKRASAAQVDHGLALIVLGLFHKVVIADGIFRPAAEHIFERNVADLALCELWLGPFVFAHQVYGDFAGYSLMAMGMASCLGVALPVNFNCPFASASFSELWQRWHISLTKWLGAYLFRPLTRRGSGRWRVIANVWLVMLLSGLWHGAGATFIIWGGLHALFLTVERLTGWRRKQVKARGLRRVGPTLLVYALFCLATVPFRAHDLNHAAVYASAMFDWSRVVPKQLSTVFLGVLLLALLGSLLVQWRMRNQDLRSWLAGIRPGPRMVGFALLIVITLLCMRDPTSYVYFRF